MKEFRKVGVAGAGSWGTALAALIASRDREVVLWARNPVLVKEIRASSTNKTYLPGISLPGCIVPTTDLSELLDCDLVLLVPPSRAFRELCRSLAALSPAASTLWVSCTKGLDYESGQVMSEVAAEELGTENVAVLSGPNLAGEIARGIPAAAVIGCQDAALGPKLQEFLTFPTFRAYTSADVRGIQLGGALKNVFAIGAGCSDGFGMGDNAKAALVTRSLAEMMRLGEALGGKRETFHGLSGIGDLMVTCFSPHSRNRKFGERIGRGEKVAEIAASVPTVAEGYPTALAAWNMAKKLGIETPVVDGVHAVLYKEMCPKEITKALLGRAPKAEAC